MEPTPDVLDYHRPVPPAWRAYVKPVVQGILVLAVVIALGWVVRFAWAAWGRQQAMAEYTAAYEALKNYTIPAGTVVLDPLAEPLFTMKTYVEGNSRYSWNTLTNPNDPLIEQNLRRIRRFNSFSVYPLATERQTARGTAFVYAEIVVHSRPTTPPQMTMLISEERWTPGAFPSYQFASRGFIAQVDFEPSPGRGLPIVLAGQVDASPSSWTLPLIIDGRKEWVRFDHSTPYPTLTASFGQITPNRRPYQIRY
jgi:hypothetical protein